jgi:hypothetical protein
LQTQDIPGAWTLQDVFHALDDPEAYQELVKKAAARKEALERIFGPVHAVFRDHGYPVLMIGGVDATYNDTVNLIRSYESPTRLRNAHAAVRKHVCIGILGGPSRLLKSTFDELDALCKRAGFAGCFDAVWVFDCDIQY